MRFFLLCLQFDCIKVILQVMAEKSKTPQSVMTDEMFEQHHERVFANGSPIDGLINPDGLKEARKDDIADTIAQVRPKLIERFPALEAIDPLVVDELAVISGSLTEELGKRGSEWP